MVSYISHNLSLAWEWLSSFSYLQVDLSKTDIYTYETFEYLQNQRFEKGMDYYICVVHQNENTYIFDAESFIYHCIKNNNKVVVNPINRQPIENFSIYVSTSQNPAFRFYMGNEVLIPQNRIPIFLSNPDLEEADQRFCIETRGVNLLKSDPKTAQTLLEIANDMGSKTAKIHLVFLFSSQKNQHKVNEYALKCYNEDKNELNVNELLNLGRILCAHNNYSLAIKFYRIAAEKKSQFALTILINILEGNEGKGMQKDLSEAQKYREHLPQEWRDKPILEYHTYLNKNGYNSSMTGYLEK